MLTLKHFLLTLCVLKLVKTNPLYQGQHRQPCSVQGQPLYHQQPPNPYYQPQHSPPPVNQQQSQCGRYNYNPQAATACHQTPCQRQQPSSQQQVPVGQQPSTQCQQPSPARQHQPIGCQKTIHQGSALNNLGLPLNQELGQYLVERLFANPVFREILSQKQAVTMPIQKTEPQVVNNYFIVPKDLFLNNTECIRELQRPDDIGKGRRRPNDRKVKECITNKAEKRLATGVVDNPSDMRTVKEPRQFSYPEEYNREHRERPSKAMKSNPINNANGANASKNPIPLVIGLVNKSNKTETKNTNKQHRETQNVARTKPKDSKVSFLSDEYIFNDFKKKFPHIPDEMAKNMIKQMKEQVRKQYSNYVDTNPGPVQYVVRKKSKNSENNRRHDSEANKQPKSDTAEIFVNNSLEVSQNESNYNATEVHKLGINKSTENTIKNQKEIITTPKAIEIDATTEGFKYYKPETSDNTTPLTINGHYSARLPELGAEDAMPNIDENDLIGETDFPDYYPDFNFDNHAYHLEALEEFANDNIQRNGRKADENRETMFNAETHPKPFRKMGRKFRRQRLRNKGNTQSEKLKPTEPVPEKNLVVLASLVNDSNNEEEEIVFQIPPGLDSPDFRTIQIIAIDDDTESYETDKYSREPHEKFSTYSEIKNDENSKPINEIRKVKVTKPRDVTDSDIETVFARSRVVNYATPKDLAFEETVTVKSNVLFASDGLFPNTLADDGLSSFVVAKSFDEFGDSTR